MLGIISTVVARVKAATKATSGVGTGVSGSGKLDARETMGDDGTAETGSAGRGSGIGSILAGVALAGSAGVGSAALGGSARVTEDEGTELEAGTRGRASSGRGVGLSTKALGAGLARTTVGFVRLNWDQYCFITSLEGVAIGSSSVNPLSPVDLPGSTGASTPVDATTLGGGGGPVEGTTAGTVGGTSSSPTGRVVSYIETNMIRLKGFRLNRCRH